MICDQSSGLTDALPYRLLIEGPFKPAQVIARCVEARPHAQLPAAAIAAVSAAWDIALAGARQRRVSLFDGPMARLDGFRVLSDSLELTLGTTSFRWFVGTNQEHARGRWPWGREVMANPLGLSAALLTADRKLIFGRRSLRVHYHPGRLHPIAGTLEPAERAQPLAGILRELSEETGLESSNFEVDAVLGLVEEIALGQPEAIIAVRTSQVSESILPRLTQHGEEHAGALAIDLSPTCVIPPAEFTPVAMATLALAQRHMR